MSLWGLLHLAPWLRELISIVSPELWRALVQGRLCVVKEQQEPVQEEPLRRLRGVRFTLQIEQGMAGTFDQTSQE